MHQNYIAGRFVDARAAERIAVINPARGTKISEIPDTPAAVVGEAIDAARRAQPAWAKRPAIERAGYLRAIGPEPWNAAYVLIPWWLYEYRGDRRTLADHYAAMKRFIDWEIARAPRSQRSHSDVAPLSTQ